MATKLKVLILSHSSELAGAERSMLDLFDYWYGKDLIEPHFIIRRPIKNLARELRKRDWGYTALYYTNWSDRTPFYKRTPEAIYRSALFNTDAIFNIEKLILKLKPDVVMTNTIVSPWAAIAAYFQKVPHVWFVREYGDVDHRHIFEIGKEKMLEDIGTMSSLVVTNSKTLGKHVGEYIDPDKITPLYTPFNIEYLKQKSREKAKNPFNDENSLKLVITGRIAPSKGQDEAATAVGILNQQGFDTELCVIGAPSDLEDSSTLKAAIAKYDIEKKVHLVGHQPNPLAILKYADVGIMASKQEAFGRVTFEYMVMGMPVVGANSGATPEMIESGKNGYLYELANTNDLLEQLTHYAHNREFIILHGKAAETKAQRMMKGSHNADTLFEKISDIVESKHKEFPPPLNFAHRWLEYPYVAKRYIKESGAMSLKRMLYLRLRHRAKLIYLVLTASINKNVKRGK